MFKNIFIVMLFFTSTVFAQDANKRHEFTLKSKVAATEVKSQAKSGTCWAFATASFLESELLRMNKGKYDLSEMFIVREAWKYKTNKYYRYHGNFNILMGGQAHDFLAELDEQGIIPESIYSGKVNGEADHDHKELDALVKSIMQTIVSKKTRQNKMLWPELINSLLDIYLGRVPEKFEYEGKSFTPTEFKKYLGIETDNYIEITSFMHHPFYEAVNLEIPDNYRNKLYYNLPLEDFIAVIDNALDRGYSLVWDGSIDKDNFFRKKGYGVVPADEWDSKSKDPEKEKYITQEIRQQLFDSYEVNDDHLVHIIGTAENQEGTKFYYIKNSWGTDEKGFEGYYYFSEPFMRLRSIAVMVHKEAVPEEIRIKLKL